MPASEAIPITFPCEQEGCSESVDASSIDKLADCPRIVGNLDNSFDTSYQDNPQASPVPGRCVFGETLESSTDQFSGHIYLTQYRICIVDQISSAIANIPLLSVDSIEPRDMCILQINTKYGRFFRVQAESSELAFEWYKKLSQKICSQRSVTDVFAWKFAEVAKKQKDCWLKFSATSGDIASCAESEFDRLNFNKKRWRISRVNKNYELCKSYPQDLIVPFNITDEELRKASAGRVQGRFPTAVWRCEEKDTVLLRSSQPCVCLFSYRYPEDEKLLECVREGVNEKHSTLLIIDARSYTAAWTNRAKGGGYESSEYYQRTEIQFLGLPNIHSVRYSFQQLRSLLFGIKDQATYLQALQATQWFQHLSNLLESAQRCLRSLFDEGRSVLVHCSDGWDRTTQIVSLVKIIADPFYRTINGFRSLIRREWIDFGHKFGDRAGVQNQDSNERSPVFLQWLDCVYQLINQFPTDFEFNRIFLLKLALHSYSGLFGTFLWNNALEIGQARANSLDTISIWSYLNELNPEFINVVYEPKRCQRLRISVGVEYIVLWKDLYIGPPVEYQLNSSDEIMASSSTMMASQHCDADRISLHRAHSAESLTNTDPVMCQSSSNSSLLHGGNCSVSYCSSTARYLTTGEADTSVMNDVVKCDRNRRARRFHFENAVDVDGLTKVVDLLEERTRKIFNDKDAKIKELESKLAAMENERKRYSSGANGDFVFTNGSYSIGDDSSESEHYSLDLVPDVQQIRQCQVVSIDTSNPNQLNQADSNYCANCQSTFYLTVFKHHCRKCGKVFCANCSNYTYHNIQDSKGKQSRVCRDCYRAMSEAAGVKAPPSSGPQTPTHKEAPSHILIGSVGSQTVFG